MKIQKTIFALLILLVPTFGLTQNTTEKKKKVCYRDQLKILTTQQINQLHNGALLVRLQTKKKSIAALRKTKKDKLADMIETRQAELNKVIIRAFQDNFDFCPVYFFFSNHSENVRKKQFDKVEFLNYSLLPDTNINFDHKDFLISEFGTIEQDKAKHFDGYYTVQGENGLEKRTKYYGGSNMRFGALIIKSDQFVQLRKPFPYYVRTFDSLPIRRKPKKVVIKMNMKLLNFYNINK